MEGLRGIAITIIESIITTLACMFVTFRGLLNDGGSVMFHYHQKGVGNNIFFCYYNKNNYLYFLCSTCEWFLSLEIVIIRFIMLYNLAARVFSRDLLPLV